MGGYLHGPWAHGLLCECLTEMEAQQKKAELDKKAYDDLVRERDILSKV